MAQQLNWNRFYLVGRRVLLGVVAMQMSQVEVLGGTLPIAGI